MRRSSPKLTADKIRTNQHHIDKQCGSASPESVCVVCVVQDQGGEAPAEATGGSVKQRVGNEGAGDWHPRWQRSDAERAIRKVVTLRFHARGICFSC